MFPNQDLTEFNQNCLLVESIVRKVVSELDNSRRSTRSELDAGSVETEEPRSTRRSASTRREVSTKEEEKEKKTKKTKKKTKKKKKQKK